MQPALPMPNRSSNSVLTTRSNADARSTASITYCSWSRVEAAQVVAHQSLIVSSNWVSWRSARW